MRDYIGGLRAGRKNPYTGLLLALLTHRYILLLYMILISQQVSWLPEILSLIRTVRCRYFFVCLFVLPTQFWILSRHTCSSRLLWSVVSKFRICFLSLCSDVQIFDLLSFCFKCTFQNFLLAQIFDLLFLRHVNDELNNWTVYLFNR